MKTIRKLLYCLCALSLSAGILYVDLLYSFPDEINMYTNESHSTSLGSGVFLGDIPENLCVWDGKSDVTPLKNGEYDATLKVADKIPFKKIKLHVTSPDTLYASGELIGLRIHNRGLIVIGTSSVKTEGKSVSPAEEAGILKGDMILKINNCEVSSGDKVKSLLTENSTVTVLRNNTLKNFTVSPTKSDDDGSLKLGVWIRDSTAGVGTLTFFDSGGFYYGALGHVICDSDTGVPFDVRNGSIEKSKVVSVTKGQSGNPGEITGSFSSTNKICGDIIKNCDTGIFGKISPNSEISGKSYPIGVMSQVKEGKATILSTVDDSTKEYEIKILRSMPFGSLTKGLMIEVTDKDLLSKTGGIVQGMSGSPIIQNGKLVGAVTHVLVNDPTRGYGIFIENMLKEAG